MKTRILLIIAFLTITTVAFGQQKADWNSWSWLMGEWVGEGSGQPGQGGGTFSFSYELDKNVIVRKSHSEYPATEKKPAVIHDDIMIVYPNVKDNSSWAIYFDNEGHVIHYQVTCSDKSITLTSEKMDNAPVFRLIYTLLDNGMINTKFEMSRDGINFFTYIEGKSKKTH